MGAAVHRGTGGPRPGVCLARGAGPEVREDLVDHRRLGNERDEPHGAMAGRTRQRVDLEDLLEQGRPPAAGLGRRESWRGDDGGQRRGGGLGLTPHSARAAGIPAIVPRRDMPLLRNVHEHSRQELERVSGLGPRARSTRRSRTCAECWDATPLARAGATCGSLPRSRFGVISPPSTKPPRAETRPPRWRSMPGRSSMACSSSGPRASRCQRPTSASAAGASSWRRAKPWRRAKAFVDDRRAFERFCASAPPARFTPGTTPPGGAG